jgi:hypothetical protein
VFVPTVGNELKLLPNVSTVGTVVPSSSGKPIRGNINTKTGAAPTFTPDTSILSGGTVSGENGIIYGCDCSKYSLDYFLFSDTRNI